MWFEAEITSLKLQLDRYRNELVHYTTEAMRLAQQLRLKNQYQESQVGAGDLPNLSMSHLGG